MSDRTEAASGENGRTTQRRGGGLYDGVSRRRVLVFDSDYALAAAIYRELKQVSVDVDLAYDSATALVYAERLNPDLIVLDPSLPGMGGIDACAALRQCVTGPAAPRIMALTSPDKAGDVAAGADCYMAKPIVLERLTLQILELLCQNPIRPEPSRDHAMHVGDLAVDVAAREVRRAGRELVLTALEFDLLHYFACNPRRVLTRRDLLQSVWGHESEVSSNAVDVYVGYLRAKLEAAGGSRILHTVRGVGYVLRY